MVLGVCVCVELLTKKIAFPGTCEYDMLSRIFRAYGSPSKTLWVSLTRLPSWSASISRFSHFTGAPPAWQLKEDEQRFVHDLLTPCPLQRKTAKDALEHMYLKAAPASGGNMPASGGKADGGV